MIDYNKAVYRRNNGGKPTIWYAEHFADNAIKVYYGILGKTINTENIYTSRGTAAEILSRINAKRKSGYMYLADVADSNILPVEEKHIISYLDTYLPHDRKSSTGAMLPMLAKVYDNTDDKLFKKGVSWSAQYKLNGLRCGIGAVRNNNDLFRPVKLTFQSRDGTYWHSLGNLETYLLTVIPVALLHLMIHEDYILDGELYLYGQTVNNINSYVKNDRMEANKKLQFWCYDIAVPEMSQIKRFELLDKHIGHYQYDIKSLDCHQTIPNRFIYLKRFSCYNHITSIYLRNKFIKWGFEGLILRDLDASYQFGKRNSAMWKYKAVTDGIFIVRDIIPEGIHRSNIPQLIVQNDINSTRFSCKLNGTFEFQNDILVNKNKYIGKKVFIEYGERSGVEQVPFHIKTVTFMKDTGG